MCLSQHFSHTQALLLPSAYASTERPILWIPNMVEKWQKQQWPTKIFDSLSPGPLVTMASLITWFPALKPFTQGLSFSQPLCWPQDPATHSCLCLPQRAPHKGTHREVESKQSVKIFCSNLIPWYCVRYDMLQFFPIPVACKLICCMETTPSNKGDWFIARLFFDINYPVVWYFRLLSCASTHFSQMT